MPPKPKPIPEPEEPDLSDQEWEDTNAYKRSQSPLVTKINSFVEKSFGPNEYLDSDEFKKVLLDLMHVRGQLYHWDMARYDNILRKFCNEDENDLKINK